MLTPLCILFCGVSHVWPGWKYHPLGPHLVPQKPFRSHQVSSFSPLASAAFAGRSFFDLSFLLFRIHWEWTRVKFWPQLDGLFFHTRLVSFPSCPWGLWIFLLHPFGFPLPQVTFYSIYVVVFFFFFPILFLFLQTPASVPTFPPPRPPLRPPFLIRCC